MNELQIKELEVKYELPTIDFNLDPLREQVNQIAKQYKGWVVDENDLPQAKKITAQLNKISKDIGRKRIDIAKAIKEPITLFENELKEITAVVDSLANEIKNQMDDYETERKEQKRQEIIESESWADYMIFNEQWLNKTYDFAEIERDLNSQRTIFENNALLIATTCKGVGLNVDKYLLMLTERKPIQEIVELINNDNQVKQEYQEQTPTPQQTPIISVEEAQDTTVLSFTLKVYGTKTQLKALRQFIDNNGLTYEKL